MSTYDIVYEATVYVTVDADSEEEATELGKTRFTWIDVNIGVVLDIDDLG